VDVVRGDAGSKYEFFLRRGSSAPFSEKIHTLNQQRRKGRCGFEIPLRVEQ
jgi:hypothetical protein